jgi:sporulation protein YlmC with PRC-barrel domain
MRNITYTLIGLFFLSLLFAGSSFADSGKMAICSDSSEAMMLLGTSLYTPTGVYIGDVTDLAINPWTGHIDSVLVNRIRGVGARVVAIPFGDISRTGENTFVYNPPEGKDWGFIDSNYDHLPYDAYGFKHLGPMPEGDRKFTELVESNQCG